MWPVVPPAGGGMLVLALCFLLQPLAFVESFTEERDFKFFLLRGVVAGISMFVGYESKVSGERERENLINLFMTCFEYRCQSLSFVRLKQQKPQYR